jgi:hypothetical protein
MDLYEHEDQLFKKLAEYKSIIAEKFENERL